MCLLDTIDGALMLALYTSTSLAKDPIAILYYSIVLTLVTIVVAVVIGVIQLLTLIDNVISPSGPFWDGIQTAGDHYDIIGWSADPGGNPRTYSVSQAAASARPLSSLDS